MYIYVYDILLYHINVFDCDALVYIDIFVTLDSYFYLVNKDTLFIFVIVIFYYLPTMHYDQTNLHIRSAILFCARKKLGKLSHLHHLGSFSSLHLLKKYRLNAQKKCSDA